MSVVKLYVQVTGTESKMLEKEDMMPKFRKDAETLLEKVGGKSNIQAVSHCVTRMRFVLNDPSKAEIEAIEEIPSAKGTFTQSGQFQVIIGNEVQEFYNDFIAVRGLKAYRKKRSRKHPKVSSHGFRNSRPTLEKFSLL